MKNQGKENHDFAMRNVSPGWHLGEFDSIEDFTNPKNEKRSLILRIKVTEGDDTGLNASLFCPWDMDRFDKIIASVVKEMGLEEGFNKAFPDPNLTFFSPKVVEKLMNKLPGLACKFFIEEDKNGFANVTRIVNLKTDVGKIAEKKGKPAAETKAKTEDSKPEAKEDW